MESAGFERILVTGGAGFIGSAFVRYLVRQTGCAVLNVDKLTYAGSLEALEDVPELDRYRFAQIDICEQNAVRNLLRDFRPDSIVHLAAETHVDRSIDDPDQFIGTNVVGTGRLLSETLRYWRSLPEAARADFRFLQVSTDEVFGDDRAGAQSATELSPYAPSSPYAATKAGADHLVRAWARTYGLPICILIASNNYGPYQSPEKLIPKMTLNALAGQSLPVYGDGLNARDWLHVDDAVSAIWAVLCRGCVGESYIACSGEQRSNIDVVRSICEVVAAIRKTSRSAVEDLIMYVDDRPGHDARYDVDAGKLRDELAWRPRTPFNVGLEQTVGWYAEHLPWCEEAMSRL